jgi:hypothetical protein
MTAHAALLLALSVVLSVIPAGCRSCGSSEATATVAPVSRVVVEVRTASEGGWWVSWDGRRPRELTVPPDAASLAALGEALARTHPPARTIAEISIGEGIPLSMAELVAKALRARGFVEVSVRRADGSGTATGQAP